MICMWHFIIVAGFVVFVFLIFVGIFEFGDTVSGLDRALDEEDPFGFKEAKKELDDLVETFKED